MPYLYLSSLGKMLPFFLSQLFYFFYKVVFSGQKLRSLQIRDRSSKLKLDWKLDWEERYSSIHTQESILPGMLINTVDSFFSLLDWKQCYRRWLIWKLESVKFLLWDF